MEGVLDSITHRMTIHRGLIVVVVVVVVVAVVVAVVVVAVVVVAVVIVALQVKLKCLEVVRGKCRLTTLEMPARLRTGKKIAFCDLKNQTQKMDK